MKITAAQSAALKAIAANGGYMSTTRGCSLATVRVLARHGLVILDSTTVTHYTRDAQGYRRRDITDVAARITDAGRAAL